MFPSYVKFLNCVAWFLRNLQKRGIIVEGFVIYIFIDEGKFCFLKAPISGLSTVLEHSGVFS